jgi:hypothetical protein
VAVKGTFAGMFSANHHPHLLVALHHLDETLSEVLAQLEEEPKEALFGRWRADVDPVARDRAWQPSRQRARRCVTSWVATPFKQMDRARVRPAPLARCSPRR